MGEKIHTRIRMASSLSSHYLKLRRTNIFRFVGAEFSTSMVKGHNILLLLFLVVREIGNFSSASYFYPPVLSELVCLSEKKITQV